MKTSKSVVRALALVLPAILWLAAVEHAAAQIVPARMSYQGYLTDGSGAPLGNTGPKNYDAVFRIWTDQFGMGSRIWAEQQTITVDKGYFSVLLGEGVGVSSEPGGYLDNVFVPNYGIDRYIDITVKGVGADGTDVTIAPRVRLVTSPFAFLAEHAGNAVNATLAANARGLVNGVDTPVVTVPGNGTAVAIAGNLTVSKSLAVSGVITGTTVNLTGPLQGTWLNGSHVTASGTITANQGFTGFGIVPIKGIIMYSGEIADLPAGWALCDGTQGTPDLRGRFVLASGSGSGLTSRTVGQSGGKEAHTLTAAEMPAHTHDFVSGAPPLKMITVSDTGSGQDKPDNGGSGGFGWISQHTPSATQSAGTGTPHDNIPPYYVLAYIMRIQ